MRVSNSGTAIAREPYGAGAIPGAAPVPFALAWPMVVLASITDTLATFATNVVGDLGLPGIFLLMLAESACIPIPSEATMLFAGFNVDKGEYSLLAIVVVGSLANLVGSWIAYAVGYYGRIELLERHGRKLHITPKHLDWADRWFERYGAPTVFFTRMLPIIRTFISLPGRRGADALLALHRPDARRLRPVGVRCSASSASRPATTGRSGRTPCTTSTTRCWR